MSVLGCGTAKLIGKLAVYYGGEIGDTLKINCIYKLWNIYVSPSKLRVINHSFLWRSERIDMLGLMSSCLESVNVFRRLNVYVEPVLITVDEDRIISTIFVLSSLSKMCKYLIMRLS